MVANAAGTYCNQFTYANNVLTWGGSIVDEACITLPTDASCDQTTGNGAFYVTYTKTSTSTTTTTTTATATATTTTSSAGALAASIVGVAATAMLLL